jgi:hypothetical protein
VPITTWCNVDLQENSRHAQTCCHVSPLTQTGHYSASAVMGEAVGAALSPPARLRRRLWHLHEYVHEGGLLPGHRSRHLVLNGGKQLNGLP